MRCLCSMGGVKGIGYVQTFFCKQKQNRDSRALLADLKKEIENYIGKLETTVVDSKIPFSVNFKFKNAIRVGPERSCE